MPIGRQRILAAYLNRNELLQQAQMFTAMPDPAEVGGVWEEYKKARSVLPTLKPAPSAPPSLRPLPKEVEPYLKKVESTAAFQENFGGLEYKFLQVPVDRLTSVQIFCNVEPALPPPPKDDWTALMEYALPKDPAVPGEVVVTPTGFRFSTPRYGLGPNHLRRRIIDGRATICFEHPNLVQVKKLGNNLILFNGTHRALEMHKAGRTHIPALVVEHHNPGEVEWLTGPGFWSPQFLTADPRPPAQGARLPYIPDFVSDLAVECRVALVASVIEIGFGGQQAGLPPQVQPIAIQLAQAPPR